MAKSVGKLSSGNLRTVKELILDERKLVTYISLSKDLCIHVNEAKILLRQVVDEIKAKNTNTHLNVSYMISGLSDKNSGRTTVCADSDLEARRDAFKTVFFQHIYSVCQGSSGVDSAAFVSVNKFEDFSLCAGLIKGNSCTKRSSDEIGTLKSNSQKTVEQKPVVLHKDVKEKSKDVQQNGHKDNVVKVHETKSEPTIKSEVPSPKKDTPQISNGKSSTKNENKQTKGITGFFTKSNSAPSTKPTKAKETMHEKDIKSQPEMKKETHFGSKKDMHSKVKKEIKLEVDIDDSMDVDEELPVKIKKEAESIKKTNNKKNSSLNQIKKNAKVDKKRKRVLHVSDSESDDNDPFADDKPADHESDDEIPPTPSTNTIKITSSILNPKKRRKIVDKTYTDEEGYILTRKEEIYESCSEEDVEMVKIESSSDNQAKVEKENVEVTNKKRIEVSPKEKKVTKNSKKKVSPPQKGKQATIMSFFKKV